MLAVIPARGGSKRLPRKNIHLVHGKPMILYTIEAARASNYIGNIIVSTDSPEIAEVCMGEGVAIHKRCACLSHDNVHYQAVVEEVVRWAGYKDKYLVALQANCPQITTEVIDRAVDLAYATNRHDVRTYNEDGTFNGAVWLMTRENLMAGELSWSTGFILAPMVDIHTKADVAEVEKRLDARI